jgi:hypothetical protein
LHEITFEYGCPVCQGMLRLISWRVKDQNLLRCCEIEKRNLLVFQVLLELLSCSFVQKTLCGIPKKKIQYAFSGGFERVSRGAIA